MGMGVPHGYLGSDRYFGGDVDIAARLIAALLFLVAFPAFAIDYVQPTVADTYQCNDPANIENSHFGMSPSAACSAVASSKSGSYVQGVYRYTQTYTVNSCANGSCAVTWVQACAFASSGASCGTSTYNISFGYGGPTKQYNCKSGSTPVGSGASMVCACNEGYMKINGECKQYTCPPSGSYSAVTQPDQKVSNAGDSICTGGCGYVPSSWKVGQDGQIWAAWPFKSTGSFCKGDKLPDQPLIDSGEKNSKNPAPVPCGTNQCPGTVNGATMCVPCKKQQEEGPSTSASAPSGSASSPAGSTTTTECNGVTCTTTTTTKDGTGAVVGVVEKTEKQESFCKENPQSSLCKPSSFGGACAATTCEGDAVMCAIARETYKRNCEWFEDPQAQQLAQTGQSAMTGDLRPDGHPAKGVEGQSLAFSSVIDQTDRLGAGCPADVSVSVAGKSVAIPFSSMCGNLQLVGNLMVGLCMLVAAFIVFR